VLILKGDKVIYFDTLLQVLILKGVTLHQNCAKFSIRRVAPGAKDEAADLRKAEALRLRYTVNKPLEAQGKPPHSKNRALLPGEYSSQSSKASQERS
jgi:hypothetical protein